MIVPQQAMHESDSAASSGARAPGSFQVAGALNLPVCGTILAASGLPILPRPRNVQQLLRIQFLVVVALAMTGASALVFSTLVPVVPDPSTPTAEVIFVAGAIPLALLAWRAGRTYLLTRRISGLIVVEGIVWLIGAQVGLLNFAMMDGACGQRTFSRSPASGWWRFRSRSTSAMRSLPGRSSGICAPPTWSSTRRRSWAAPCARSWSA